MFATTLPFIVLILFLGIFSFTSQLSLKIFLLLISIIIGAFALVNLVGQPRSPNVEFFNKNTEVEILFAQKQDKKLVLLVKNKEHKILFYEIPWTKEIQEQFNKARLRAQGLGLPLMGDLQALKFGKSRRFSDGKKLFYPLPQPTQYPDKSRN